MNWPLKFGLSLHLHILLGRVIKSDTISLDPDQDRQKKVNFEKKPADAKKKKKKKAKGYKCKEGFDAQAISAI